MPDYENLQLAEKSVLGSMLLSADAVRDVSEVVAGGDFFSSIHELIYRAILFENARDHHVDVVTIAGALEREGELQRCGGAAYLHTLIQEVTSPAAAEFYAQIVAKAAIRRRLGQAADLAKQLSESPGDEAELVELAHRAIDRSMRATPGVVQDFGDTIDETIDLLNQDVEYKPTPWKSLNDIIGGFQPGGLYVIGARPAVGKSAVALQAARHLARYGSVAFSSLEMSRNDINMRAMAMELGIDLTRLIRRKLTPVDWNKIANRRAAWQGMPLVISDDSGVTITDIQRFSRSVNNHKPLAGIVVDYLQLMSQHPGDKRNRQEFVSDMSRSLKKLAMDMHVPVLALSQLNRSSEARADRQPQISDLRESGAVEQDADVVVLLHRDTMGDNREDLSMIVAKNRNGITDTAHLNFYGQFSIALDKDVNVMGPYTHTNGRDVKALAANDRGD